MASVTLGTKAIGDIVKLNINGTAWEFIVVHKGKPSSIYDDSFNDGVILLMKDLYENRKWHSNNTNDYANSTIHDHLNSTLLNRFDQNIKDAMVQVKIPYRPGSGTSKTVNSGANGLSCKLFLAAQKDISSTQDIYGVADGATWDYFAGLAHNLEQSKRIARLSKSATAWWVRTPRIQSSERAFNVNATGVANSNAYCSSSCGIRPALVLPSSLFVSDDGSVVTNSPPAITDPATNANLGNKNQGFTMSVIINDPNGDKFSILAKVDEMTLINTSNNSDGTFSLDLTGAVWNGLALGVHTISITVTDIKGAESTRTMTFTKINTKPTAPVITGITTGQRLGASGSVTFTPSTDADGDTLSYTLQFASNSGFTANVQEFQGSSSPIAFSGVAVNTNRYIRVVVSDGKESTAGSAIQVKMGNVLELKSNPVNRATMPVACRVLMDWTVAEGATYAIYVCNNANDANPTWENSTSEFKAGTPFYFTNSTKVNSSWAVGLRVVINAGTATGTIEVRAFGFDITVS